MRRLIAAATVLLALPMLLPASEFDWMVREFARESGARQLHIPFFGLARLVVAVAHPVGTSELKLAVFEHPRRVDADNFSSIADRTVGSAWKPIVRVRSRDDSSNIYAQPDGKHLRLLIATLDKDDAVFVEVRIRPEELIKFVDQQRRNHHA